MSKFILLRVDPMLQVLCHPGKQRGSRKISPPPPTESRPVKNSSHDCAFPSFHHFIKVHNLDLRLIEHCGGGVI